MCFIARTITRRLKNVLARASSLRKLKRSTAAGAARDRAEVPAHIEDHCLIEAKESE